VKEVCNRLLRGELATAGIIIIGPEGETLWRGSDPHKGSYFYRTPGRPAVPFADLKKNIEPHLDKGLLGGLGVPVQARQVAAALKAGKLAAAGTMLDRLPSSGELGEFRKALAERLEELRARKRALFDGLSAAGEDWQAYKVGASYVRCFPSAGDASEMRSAVRSLRSKQTVRDNLAAKQNFLRIAGLAYGSKGVRKHVAQVDSTLARLAARYPETEFGRYAAEVSK
jgi:hypothetical protein